MGTVSRGGRSATVTINPQNQSLESVHRIVAQIVKMAGCDHCGQIAMLNIDFLGDPAPELVNENVISVGMIGFS